MFLHQYLVLGESDCYSLPIRHHRAGSLYTLLLKD